MGDKEISVTMYELQGKPMKEIFDEWKKNDPLVKYLNEQKNLT